MLRNCCAKELDELRVACEETRFEHRGLRQHVAIGLRDRFFNRARRVADLESDVPQQIENLFDHFADLRWKRARLLPVKKHHVDVAERIELGPAVAAQTPSGRLRQLLPGCFMYRLGLSENVPQQHIHEFGATGADFAAAAAGLMSQAQPMFLDLEKFFVKRKNIGRPVGARRGELTVGVRENFIEMTRHRLNLDVSNRNANSRKERLTTEGSRYVRPGAVA